MNRIRRSEFARSFLLPLALTLWLSACQKWGKVEPPSIALEQQAAKEVDERDKLRLHVIESDATVEGRLAELTEDSTVLVADDGRRAILRTDIAQVDERKANTVGTVLLILVPTVLLLVVAGSSVECEGFSNC